MAEKNHMDLLTVLENILDSDPLIDELGFIHPLQFLTLDKEDAGSGMSSGNILQSEDGVLNSRSLEGLSYVPFWCRDHKLGISTEILMPLYGAAKCAFISVYEKYKVQTNVCMNKDEFPGGMKKSMSFPFSIIEAEVMRHSRVLLLLSSDYGTAWNARKLVLSSKQEVQYFVDELFFSDLVLSYFHKSDMTWSHRRWLIKKIVTMHPYVQDIVEKESELVQKLAEKSKMNYRAWNHRCWLVSYMTEGQVLHELNKSKEWAGLNVADSSCFHYRTRLMLKMLGDSSTRHSGNVEIRQAWNEELEWNKLLLLRYAGREALWIYRRFLSLCWKKNFASGTPQSDEDVFIIDELGFVCSCLSIPNDDFGDYQTNSTLAAAYALWLLKQIRDDIGIEIHENVPVIELKDAINKIYPGKFFLQCALPKKA
ncbi:protein farnesyltransferase/geranylgeranyltransferase type-1 subunit alpha [Impatiens glandulifera]|uniref:protein farnesyltransferase/geranylgeranyltransferase type-1 subunit alpha n=1 Tax=Impatiens glandulifera TaxID=253017 RepID=UPI001FB12344|nr:protein farnesyltransferase/geranylgeranyltransferase type-1 subunit alpha [Impatiens glandulifera]